MYEHMGDGALDYLPCRYGKSKLLFRGPKRKLDGSYCAMLGGTETYGRFIEAPFPAQVEERSGCKVVNLGCVNAGVDVFAGDPSVLDVCGTARLTVVQAVGAQNMSNRFYTVHPRRNDRFLRASSLMKTVFREMDFTEFHFTRHMLTTIRDISAEKYQMVVDELKSAWVARMKFLAQRVPGKTVLLHVPMRDTAGNMPLGPDPLYVDQGMIAEVRPHFTEYVQVDPSDDALKQGTDGMVFSPMEEPAAGEIPGPAVHREIADDLSPVVQRLMI